MLIQRTDLGAGARAIPDPSARSVSLWSATMFGRSGCVILACAAMALSASAGRAETWRRYVDSLTGTSAEVPISRFEVQPPGKNSAGRVFVSRDGRAIISIYGASAMEAGSFPQYVNVALRKARAVGTRVTYRTGGDSWFVFSGYQGRRIVYEKVSVSCHRPLLTHHIVVMYPSADRATYDPLVARLSRSLQHVNRATC
jgi:hypothetical protein